MTIEQQESQTTESNSSLDNHTNTEEANQDNEFNNADHHQETQSENEENRVESQNSEDKDNRKSKQSLQDPSDSSALPDDAQIDKDDSDNSSHSVNASVEDDEPTQRNSSPRNAESPLNSVDDHAPSASDPPVKATLVLPNLNAKIEKTRPKQLEVKNLNGKRPHPTIVAPTPRSTMTDAASLSSDTPLITSAKFSSEDTDRNVLAASTSSGSSNPSSPKNRNSTSSDTANNVSLSAYEGVDSSSNSTTTPSDTNAATSTHPIVKIRTKDPSYGLKIVNSHQSTVPLGNNDNQKDSKSTSSTPITIISPSTTSTSAAGDDSSSTSSSNSIRSSSRYSKISASDREKYAQESDAQETRPTQDVTQPQNQGRTPTASNSGAQSKRDYIRAAVKHPFSHRRRHGGSGSKRDYIFHANPTEAQKKKFPSNEIRTTKYRWYTFFFLNLLEQYREYSNIYFLFIMILSLLPGLSPVAPITAILPVVFILSANMIREGIQDILRWKEDKKSNFEKCTVLRAGKWTERPKKDLQVGEFVKVERNGDVPADIIVISSSNAEGLCFIETSNLDGETTMKIKSAKGETSHLQSEQDLSKAVIRVTCEAPHKQFDFNGTISLDSKGEQSETLMYDHFVPRSSTLLNTDYIIGLVTYTGKHTKMFLNLKKTKTKFSIMQKTLNKIFFGIIILNQFFAAMMVLGSLLFHEYTTRTSWYLFDDDAPSFEMAFTNYLSALILLNLMIPMSLYVSLEFVKMIQAKFMTWDNKMKHKGSPLAVYSNNLNSDLAKIEIIFSDKTGTLTENKMKFKYSSIDMIRFDEYKESGSLSKYMLKKECDKEMKGKIQMLLFCLSVCHTVIPHELPDDESELTEADEEGADNDNDGRNSLSTPIGGRNGSAPLRVATHKDHTQSPADMLSPRGGEESDLNSIDPASTPETATPKHKANTTPKIRFDGESPDEIALINFAKDNDYVLTKRSQDTITVSVHGEEKRFQILALMPFSSRRKRMSIVIRDKENDDRIIVFTKGADSEMLQCLEQNRENALHRNKATELLTSFSKEGLRTLVMSYKVITQEQFDAWHEEWHVAENALENRNVQMDDAAIKMEEHGYTLLGTTAIEDCLQEKVPETLRFFREAGVQIWMLTGDKMETAINIGRSSEMISQDAQQFILNTPLPPNYNSKEVAAEIEHQLDRILEFQGTYFIAMQGKILDVCILKNKILERKFVDSVRDAETVICCRATPDQKAMLVKLGRRRLKKLGLAVGDGANDVSMIQQARVGVGIRGREGSQAARASDFSIARFYLMKRLLAVHGHWSYYRSAKFVQYSFYKNMLVTFYQILFTIFNGYTMQTLIDSWILTFYNVIFTLLIPFVFGIFEKDIPDYILEQDPRIYTATLKERIFSSEASFAWIFRAFFHSTVIFFVCMFFTENTGLDDLWTQAAMLCLVSNWVIVLKGFIEMKYHTAIHYFALWFSVVSLHVFYLIYSAFASVPSTGGAAYYVTYIVLSRLGFYLVLPLVLAMCLIPELAWKLILNMIHPKVRMQIKAQHFNEQKRVLRRQRKNRAAALPGVLGNGAAYHVRPRRDIEMETLHAVDSAFGLPHDDSRVSKFSPSHSVSSRGDLEVSSVSGSDEDGMHSPSNLGTPIINRDPSLIPTSPPIRKEAGEASHSTTVLSMPRLHGHEEHATTSGQFNLTESKDDEKSAEK